MSFDALEEPWVPVWFCMGQTNESDLAVLSFLVVRVFPDTVKFSTTTISLTTTWASSASAVSLGLVLFYLMLLCTLC